MILSCSELFPAFNCAKEVGNLLSSWLGVSILNPFADCSSCAADSSLSRSGVSFVSGCSSSDSYVFGLDCSFSDFKRGGNTLATCYKH